MAPSKWDEEEEESTPPSSPPVVARRGKFDDEEEDSDVLETWEEAEDSEVEREKAKKAAEAKAKADAEAKASHLTKAQRIEARRQENLRKRLEDENFDTEEDDEDEAARRQRLREQEQAADMEHAEELFGAIQVTNTRKVAKPVVATSDPADPTAAIDLSALSLFNPNTKDQFTKLRETLVPLISSNVKKAQYVLFMQELTKQLCKDLPSDQIKKIGSGITTLSNEKMKEEKLADKGGKKSKAAKTKASLVATRDVGMRADMNTYDDFGDDDFM